MKKKIVVSLSLLTMIITFVVSCGNRYIIQVSDMQPRLQYTGFSVARPQNTGWFVDIREQENKNFILRKNLSSPTHTAFVKIKLIQISRPANSQEDFDIINRERHTFEDTIRFKLVSYTQYHGSKQGQMCLFWEEHVIDNNSILSPSHPLRGRSTGFACIHPLYKNNEVILEAEISERGLEGELDPLTIKEGEEILKSIVLTDTMGVPLR